MRLSNLIAEYLIKEKGIQLDIPFIMNGSMTYIIKRENNEFVIYTGCGERDVYFNFEIIDARHPSYIPQNNADYFYLNEDLEVKCTCFMGDMKDIHRIKSGNCSRTSQEALNYYDRIEREVEISTK